MKEEPVLIPEWLYDSLIKYFDSRSDTDFDGEDMIPNKEMKLLNELQNCKK